MKNVIAIFDAGKTNKKLLLFDEHYKVVFERIARFTETTDEDGFPCENLESLIESVVDSLQEVIRNKEYNIIAVNFSAYGASFVYLDEKGKPVAPLYNYLKPCSENLVKQFYNTYGGEEEFSQLTASPVLGNLNSGMQLYCIKYGKPELFAQIKYALHLPQFLSYLISGRMYSDITSIGCHTNLWNFEKNNYHEWVAKEGILEKLAPVLAAEKTITADFSGNTYQAGIGLHDSSAALIPYLINFKEPFVLISTGTWCITLNPFNHTPLTPQELKSDCLCYLQYNSSPVKAARLFSGHEHDEQVKRIAEYFKAGAGSYKNILFNDEIIAALKKNQPKETSSLTECAFAKRNLSSFASEEEAYHQLIIDLVAQQFLSAQLVMGTSRPKRIFVDGGFSKNDIYMNLLATVFPDAEVYAASMAQASALGAALAIHKSWNTKPISADIIELKYYSAAHTPSF